MSAICIIVKSHTHSILMAILLYLGQNLHKNYCVK